jgi:hypothetical protein
MTRHARQAWRWIEANRHRFQADIHEPWVVYAQDNEVEHFLSRACVTGARYEDIRDHLMFNFQSADDMVLFTEQHFVANFCLLGSEYLANNVNHFL